jgi:hypothetical protein
VNRAFSRHFFAAAAGIAVLTTAGMARAATAIWNPPTGDRSWSTAANWSTGVVPGSGDDVVADGNVADNRIDVDIAIDVKSITTQNGYSRAIAGSGANSIRVRGNVTLGGTGDFECSSGTTQIDGNVSVGTSETFSANGGTVTILGNVTQTGGTINGLSGGPLSVGGNVNVSGGNLNGGNGLMIIAGNVSISSGGTFRASDSVTRLGGAFSNTGGTFTSNSGLFVFTSKTNQTHTFGGSVFRKTVFNDGMVGYWNLDENGGSTITDNSGFTNTGTSTALTWGSASPPALAFVDTSYGTFNGTSSRIALTVSQLPAANAAQSIAAWVNINALPGSASSIVSLTGSSSAVKLGLSSTSLRVLRNDGTALVTTTAPSTGTWHHVAYTWNGTSNTLYVDGVAVIATATAHDGAAVTGGFIGATSAVADFFNGSIDEVRIYDRALTAAEVSSLAIGRMPGTSIATHTFSDPYRASIGGNVADLILASGTVTGSSTITVEGSWLNYGGRFTGTGTVTLTSGAAERLLSGGSSFASLTITAAGANYTMRDRLSIPNGPFTLSAGRIQCGAYTMRVGTMALTAGATFTVGTGTVVVDGVNNQTLPSTVLTNYNNLRLEDPNETGLVGYWKLDEGAGTTVRDWSGNGNTLTLSTSGATWSGTVPSTVTFDNPGSMTLDGAAGWAGRTSAVAGLPAANAVISISAWVKFNSTAGTQNMVALVNSGAANAVQLGIRGGNLTAWIWGGTALVQVAAPTDGLWHQVTYTYDGTTDRLYLDGVVTSATGVAHQTAAPTAVYIGSYNGGAEILNGTIDDVRIYNVGLTDTQVARLAAGRYAGTGGVATMTLGANTTVAGTFAVDSANLSSSTFTFNHSLTSAVAAINSGTYTVGSAAQQFQGGLTVQSGGALTMATSGGSVEIAATKTLTMDGTLNASNTGAIIRSVSGTYGFSVGSTASARPTLNITGLTVQNTNASGMRVNVDPNAITSFTRFDNLVFLAGTTTYLNIQAKALYLTSSGSRFGITTGGVSDGTLPTNNVTLTGNGTADGDTRIVFGTATCAAAKTTAGYCQDAWTVDDDPDNNGVGNTPATNGAVVQYVRSASTDTAGSIEGFPTSAFDWNTFAYYSTYVAYHDASGTADRIYVRDQAGTAKYQWDTPSGEHIIGTPRWNTTGTTHYLFVALTSGKVYRLVDNGTSLALDSSVNWAGANNPFNCGCTIVSPLSMDTNNVFWGGTTAGPVQKIWTLGQVSRAQPMGSPFVITPTLTAASPGFWPSGATTYLYFGLIGNIIKFNASNQTLEATNTNPGSAAIRGRVVPTVHGRVYAGDDGGTMWALNQDLFAGTQKVWSYAIAGDSIQSAPYYDSVAQFLHFGTDGGKVIVLNSTGTAVTGYPFVPGSTSDSIRTALLYSGGILVVGTTTGKLFFLDRQNGTTGPALVRQYYFGPTEAVSGIGYDSFVNRYMVTTADPATNDGRLYYIDLVADPTAATP